MLERACTLLEPMHRAIQAVDHADPITGQILGGSGAAKHATHGAIEIAQPARPQRSFDIAKENDAIACAAIFGPVHKGFIEQYVLAIPPRIHLAVAEKDRKTGV